MKITDGPVFLFSIKLMEIECFLNEKDEVVEGGDDNVVNSQFYFALSFDGEMIEKYGHPWKIIEFQKGSKLSLLV